MSFLRMFEPDLMPAPMPLPRRKAVWFTNGEVAWLIKDRLLAHFYACEAYLPQEGWFIIQGTLGSGWIQGICAEMRRCEN